MEFVFKKIKEERKKRKYTLKQLSEKSNVSSGLISSIERGIVNPSIDVLIRLCKALNIHPGYIINDEERKSEPIIMRRKDQYGIADRKATSFIVSPMGLHTTKNAVLLTYLKNGEEFGRKHISYDTVELIVVLRGKVKLFYGQDEHILEIGDSAYFSADKIHYLKNLDTGESALVWCVFNK